MKAIFLDDAGVTGHKWDPDQPIFLLGGVILDFDRLPAIHRRVDGILSEIFARQRHASFPEIHARPIVSGKGAFRRFGLEERLEIFERIYHLVDECEGKLCYFVFDKKKCPSGYYHPYEITFQLLCERIDEYLERQNSHALIFMDRNSEVEQALMRNLISFRTRGFRWGIPRRERMTRIIGALHTVESAHDVFIQIADLVVYGLYQKVRLRGMRINHGQENTRPRASLYLR